ncbi:cell division protein FtsA [Algiphilus aromaticivorans]|jgi:cell division protein FtsA|uniref:cell division protein FtsA n=1 Tax=Algiphilus aromaticivorans TaxID=382454 RepID=UPI0005C232C3|nr:cell division protein FtsA [Algiphilus aromaticivorans]
MAKKGNNQLLVGLDIGTSKVAVIVADTRDDGTLEIIGHGEAPSKGLSRGVVVDIEATTSAIRRAVEEAELMAGCRVQSVYAGISGNHVRAVNSQGIVAVRNREVTETDKERVIDAARAVVIPADQRVLHVVPQEWSVDGQEGIREPAGMAGVRLEAKVHIVSVGTSAAQNIYKCVEGCGLEIDRLILEPLASSYAVLQPDERDLGVCLVDIGHGTADIAIFKDGSIRHIAVVPVAGEYVTRDIAAMFRTPSQSAESIKRQYGCAWPPMCEPGEAIEVPSTGDHPARQISRQEMAEVIKARYEELFREFIARELHRSGFYDLIASGIVLTGGSARLPGVIELAEEIFQVPVRLGLPQEQVKGITDVTKNPSYATAVGLLLFGRDQRPQERVDFDQAGLKQLWGRLRNWFQGNF